MARSRSAKASLVAGVAALVASIFAFQPAVQASAPAVIGGGRLPASAGQAKQSTVVMLKAGCPQRSRLTLGDGYCPAQDGILGELRGVGDRVVAKAQLVDAVVALVTSAQAKALSHQAAVRSVLTDGTVPLGPAPGWAQDLSVPELNQPTSGATHSAGRSVEQAKVPAGAKPATPTVPSRPTTFPGCGTKANPALGQESLTSINDLGAVQGGIDGAGVTVAVLADGVNPANPDLARNPKYGPAGHQVVTRYVDFSGDGLNASTGGAEAFGDVSTIAAQGNRAYNVAVYDNAAGASYLPKRGCYIKVVGAAPGASVEMLKVLPQQSGFSTSQVLEALQYAVKSGAKVINESFGSDAFPDTGLDVLRDADDAAVLDGATVVVSTGDAGVTSTVGSPATDPNLISVGASTDFRSYAQTDEGGFDNPVVGNGKWLDNNISALSSGGFSQSGNTVNLVAPGDSDWALCSTNTKKYTECSDPFRGTDNGIQLFGGTSEAAPLTSAAAADVIEAFRNAHGGTYPSPALVKEILTSTATDIDAPADEQGAGLLNVGAAVHLARTMPAPTPSTTTTTTAPKTTTTSTTSTTAVATTTSTSTTTTSRATLRRPGGAMGHGPMPVVAPSLASASTGNPASASGPPNGTMLVSPSQLNSVVTPGQVVHQALTFTNVGPNTKLVHLSTRALRTKIYDTGTRAFTINPNKPLTNTGAMVIGSGYTEVYQEEQFKVPAVTNGRLIFQADYQFRGQSSVLHVALFEPSGTYAAFTDPQGFGDYAETEVSNPVAGTWTALFYTIENGTAKGIVGTSGPVQWDASVWRYSNWGTVSPANLSIAPGGTAHASLSVRAPNLPGDNDLAVVVSTPGGQTTVPVTVRTMVALGKQGGTFSAVLTGGNGRADTEAASNTYSFSVPAGQSDLDVGLALSTDPDESLIGYLVDPSGQTMAYTTNYTVMPTGSSFSPKASYTLAPASTPFLELYAVAPMPGQWSVVLDWANPVSGNEINERFTGSIRFDQVKVTASGAPTRAARVLDRGSSHVFHVRIVNNGLSPQAYFFDPRLDQTTTVTLTNQNSAVIARNFSLPLVQGLTYPFYLVPTHTSELSATLTRLSGSTKVSFDMEWGSGDPDVAPGAQQLGTASSLSGSSASVSLSETSGIAPGLWSVSPADVGPYPTGGAPSTTASLSVSAVTQAFDKAISTPTDDLWQKDFSASHFVLLQPGQSANVPVTVKPSAAVGTNVTGTLYVDAFTLAAFFAPVNVILPDAEEVAALPYSYTVGR